MDIFAKVLQGPYAYLLVLQVLIVSGLLLTLIYLIVLRLRETPIAILEEKAPEADPPRTADIAAAPILAVSAGVAAAPESLLTPTPIATPESAPMIPTLPTPPVAPAPVPEARVDMALIEAEKERASALEGEANAMRDKVRYLESKLLEYEILQEEIGALSALKLENERLRQELIMGKPRGAPPAAAAPLPTPSPADALVSSVSASEAAITPQSAAAAAAELLAAPSVTPLPTGTPELPEATDDSTRAALDGLMRDLETVTDKSSSKSS